MVTMGLQRTIGPEPVTRWPHAQIDSRSASPGVAQVVNSSGQPLDHETRAVMEPRFGHDFSHVRVHTDERAAESARAVSALAYTVGEHIVFADGQYAPNTVAGRRLLAHELTHTIQQQATPCIQRQAVTGSHMVMLDEAIAVVERALDALVGPTEPGTGPADELSTSTADAERIEHLRIARSELYALRRTGNPDDILRAVQPILAAAERDPSRRPRAGVQRKGTTRADGALEREADTVADQVVHGGQAAGPFLVVASASQSAPIQRQGGPAEATLVGFGVASGPPGWAILAGVAVVGLIGAGIYMASRPRSRSSTRTAERAEPVSGGPSRPPPGICHTAIKILTQYTRLAQKFGVNLPKSRIAELDRLRDAGQITINHIPGTLREGFPFGTFGDMTLAAIRAMCGM